MRKCVKCGFESLNPEQDFFRDSKSADGFRRDCKSCRKQADKRRNPALVEPAESTPRPTSFHLRPDRPWRIFHITDIHVPDHDPLAWSIILQIAYFEQPDEILIMGDFAEVAAFSQHGKFQAVMTNWETEKAAIRHKLEQLRRACPKAVITYLEGNHETRIRRYLADREPQLLETLTLPKELDLESLDIAWVPEDRQPITRGNLLVLHGHQMGRGKGGYLPQNHAKKACELYGAPGRVITYGHVHKHQTWDLPMYGGNARAVAIACGRDLHAPWLNGSVSGWSQQVGFSYVRPAGTPDLFTINITHGAAQWNGHLYVGVRDDDRW